MDTTYRLIVDMSARGTLVPAMDRVGTKAKGLDDAFKKVGESAAAVGATLASAFTGAVEKVADIGMTMAKVGAVAAGGALAYGVTHLNNELEKTQISLAAIFGANGQTTGMQDGMLKAGAVMKDMRKDAAALPGEFKDLIGIFRNAAIPGFQAGMGIGELRSLSAKVMAAAAVTGVPMEQAAREFAMLMEGRAGSHNVLGLRLAGLGGHKAEEFNKSTGAERVKTLTTALEKFAPAIDTYSTSFDGLSSTMIDNAKKFLGTATSGLFDRAKIAMIDANKWWDNHEDSALGFADKIGEKLNYAFDVGRRKVEEWWHPTLVFAGNAKDAIADVWNSIEPVLDRLGPKVKAALYDPGTIDHVRDVLKLYGAVKVGSMALPMMGQVGGLFSSMGGAVGGMGMGELAMASGPLAALLIAAAGAVHVLGEESGFLHERATTASSEIQTSLGNTLEHLKMTGERLEPVFVKVADVMGTVLLVSLEGAATGIEAFAGAINMVTTAIGNGISSIEADVNRWTGLTLRSLNPDGPVDPAREPFAPMSLKVMDALANDINERAKPKTGAGGGGGGTNIQKVEIVISTNQDPSRIARLTVDRLEDISRHPTSSRYVRNFSAAR